MTTDDEVDIEVMDDHIVSEWVWMLEDEIQSEEVGVDDNDSRSDPAVQLFNKLHISLLFIFDNLFLLIVLLKDWGVFVKLLPFCSDKDKESMHFYHFLWN